MTEKECKKLMEERGFRDTGITDVTLLGTSMYFIYPGDNDNKRFPIPHYSVEVRLYDKCFKCSWIIPHSVNQITTGYCSTVDDDNQFDRIVMKFEQHCSYVYKFIGE